jgi:hypothetical protein
MASFTSSSLLKYLTPKNSFNIGNKWKSLEAKSEQHIVKNMYKQCTDGLNFLDDPCSMAVRSRPVLAVQLGYYTLWYNLCRGIWNSAVMCMCAEGVPSCFFGGGLPLWHLCWSVVFLSVMDCRGDKLSTIACAVYCCKATSGGTYKVTWIVLVASSGFWILTSQSEPPFSDRKIQLCELYIYWAFFCVIFTLCNGNNVVCNVNYSQQQLLAFLWF